jgi:metal-responsive CopG/Arc/MetJ family transcriptional regulator
MNKTPSPKDETLHIRIDEEFRKRIDAIVSYEKRPRTEVVRDAIRFYASPSEAQQHFEMLSEMTKRDMTAMIFEQSQELNKWIMGAKHTMEVVVIAFTQQVVSLQTQVANAGEMLDAYQEVIAKLTGMLANKESSSSGQKPRSDPRYVVPY